MENPNCICPRKSCARHGKCDECQAYHNSTEVLNFCKWVKVTGCDEPVSKDVLGAWLKGDNSPWIKRK